MTIVYVDGESHFIRAEKCWQKLHGENARLESARMPTLNGTYAFPDSGTPYVRVNRVAKFFWDTNFSRSHATAYLDLEKGVYFTSCVGDRDYLHDVRRYIRSQSFEPEVIHEQSSLAKHRRSSLEKDHLIEKPKGVDIRLAVRILEDAYRGHFAECMLLTSDIDFLPVIESVERMGKRVYVFGFRVGLGSQSDFEHVPERFIDLELRMSNYEFVPPDSFDGEASD